jgi:hypothetical protein
LLTAVWLYLPELDAGKQKNTQFENDICWNSCIAGKEKGCLKERQPCKTKGNKEIIEEIVCAI